MNNKLARLVNELETKIKTDIEVALAKLNHRDSQEQLLEFLRQDIEELQALHEKKHADPEVEIEEEFE